MLTTAQQFSGAAGVALIGVVFYSGLGSHPGAASHADAMTRLIGMDLALIAIILVLSTLLRRPLVVDVDAIEEAALQAGSA